MNMRLKYALTGAAGGVAGSAVIAAIVVPLTAGSPQVVTRTVPGPTVTKTVPAPHPTAPSTPAPKPSPASPAPKPAHIVPQSYRCVIVSDLGGKTVTSQPQRPVYYKGTAYCDDSSVQVIQRDEQMRADQENSDDGGPVACTYVRMGEAYCSDGTYAPDPNEIPRFTKP